MSRHHADARSEWRRRDFKPPSHSHSWSRGRVGTDILKRRNSTSYLRLVWTSQLLINHRTVRQWLTPMGKYEPAYELLHFCHGFHRQYNTYQRGFRHCLSSKEWQCEGQNKRDGQEPESRAFFMCLNEVLSIMPVGDSTVAFFYHDVSTFSRAANLWKWVVEENESRAVSVEWSIMAQKIGKK